MIIQKTEYLINYCYCLFLYFAAAIQVYVDNFEKINNY